MNRIEFQIPRVRERNTVVSLEDPRPPVRAPRITRLLALAHKLDGLVRSGAVSSYAELARLGGISQSRLFQILIFVNLSPALQERILFLTAAEAESLYELDLRTVAREASWSLQHEKFETLRRNR